MKFSTIDILMIDGIFNATVWLTRPYNMFIYTVQQFEIELSVH